MAAVADLLPDTVEPVLFKLVRLPKGEQFLNRLRTIGRSLNEGATNHGSGLHDTCQCLARQLAGLHGILAPGFGHPDCDQFGVRVELWIMEFQGALDRLVRDDDDTALRQLLHTAHRQLKPLLDAMTNAQAEQPIGCPVNMGCMSSCSDSLCLSSEASSVASSVASSTSGGSSASSSTMGAKRVAMRSKLSYSRHWAGKVCV